MKSLKQHLSKIDKSDRTLNVTDKQLDDGYKVFKQSWDERQDIYSREGLTVKDAFALPNANLYLPRVIVEIARDAIEPNIVLTNLLQKVPYEAGLKIVKGGVGAVEASEVAEAEAYPEFSVNTGGNTVTASVGKFGLKFKFTDELADQSSIDFYSLYIAKGGAALKRLKEQKIAQYITEMGQCVFDNQNPSGSYFGVTTGRDETGAANASLTADDLFDAFGAVINNGYMPNLMILHPLTWIMFMKDPVLRAFTLAAGGSGTWWGGYTGNPAMTAMWGTPTNHEAQGKLVTPPGAVSGQATPAGDRSMIHTQTSAPQVPGYFLPFAFNIVVTPFVWFETDSKLTDIMIADSSQLGYLFVDKEISVEEWREPAHDVNNVKLFERYSIHIAEEGLAIAVIKNVKLEPSRIVLPGSVQLTSLPSIPATTPLV